MFSFSKTSPSAWDKVENWQINVPYSHHGEPGHRILIENFCNAILNGEPLIVPAVEGIKSVTLGNAIMMSSFLGRPVDLPLDEDAYEARLQELIATSRYHKPEVVNQVGDPSKSFGYH
jgi:hypothetical protein